MGENQYKLFGDYQDRVVEDYERKKAEDSLPSFLREPTPAKVREACLKMCAKGVERKDEKMLSEFFGESDGVEGYVKSIYRTDVSKYKPLLNFLRKETSSTDERNIELLAWIIDFERRPFRPGWAYPPSPSVQTSAPINSLLSKPGDKGGEEELKPKAPVVESTPTVKVSEPEIPILQEKKNNRRNVIMWVLGLVVVGAAFIFWIRDPQPPRITEACMYWDEDHYEQISCAAIMRDVLIVGLDSGRLRNFRKVSRSDIDYNSIRKIWYGRKKDGTKYDYFTAGGKNPFDTSEDLRPITQYIIRRYVLEDTAR